MSLSETSLVQVLLKEQPRLLAFIQSIIRRDGLVDDLFQDISLQAVRTRGSIENEEHFVRWLYTTARNRAIDELRKKQIPMLDYAVLEELADRWTEQDPHDPGSQHEALNHCLDRLQPKARRLLQLRYDDGLTGEDIASRLDKTPAAIYMQLSRIRQALQRCIESYTDIRSKKGGSLYE